MTVVASPAERLETRRRSLGERIAWHPEWWLYAVAGLAWADLALMQASMSAGTMSPGTMSPGTMSSGSMTGGHGGMVMSTASESFASGWADAFSHWSLMALAMMLPVVAPQVRTVALRSLWWRRQRSAGCFTAGYLVVWMAAGAVLVTPLVALDAYPLGLPWLVVLLLVAAGWQVSKPRKRVLRRCGSLRLGAASGRAADLNCLRLGLRSGQGCLVTCGPVMLTMVASHNLLLMAGLLVVLLSERWHGPDPVRRAGRPLEAWVLVGFAAIAGAVLALG